MVSEYLHLLTDPAHWAFELSVEFVTFSVGAFFGRFWLRAHDRKHHTPKLQENN
jgi:hypothetical protein